MCEPTTATLATAAIVTSVAGTAVSAYGQYQQGKAAQSAADYQAAVLRNNALIAERNAKDALTRGKEAEAEHGRQVKQLIGRQRAVLAGNGVVVDQDSALDITADTAETGKYEQLIIRSNAEREALGYQMQAYNFGADAGLAQAKGGAAYSAGLLGALGTTLSGSGSVAEKWYTAKRDKVF